jgi:hypothetical protein
MGPQPREEALEPGTRGDGEHTGASRRQTRLTLGDLLAHVGDVEIRHFALVVRRES